jgi:hypothetical protein
MSMIVDGERLSRSEVRKLVKFFNDECREYAGQFFDQVRKGLLGDAGRSEKFRAFWSEIGFRCGKDLQICYVESHYQNFAEDVRAALAGLLARPDVSEFDKQRIHKALIVQQVLGMNSQNTPVQLQKDSQTFAGDRFENKQTAINFGNAPDQSAMQRLLGSTTIH